MDVVRPRPERDRLGDADLRLGSELEEGRTAIGPPHMEGTRGVTRRDGGDDLQIPAPDESLQQLGQSGESVVKSRTEPADEPGLSSGIKSEIGNAAVSHTPLNCLL
ncbi:hypothetical protein Pve01_01110 [Planomonospora venezuelensis]|nr:hypothetical protein Pve01_01110 [Planomonospora venezuelensis]